MALSEYVLLVSLSAGIHAHGDVGGISIGAEAITQPNGAARHVHVAVKTISWSRNSIAPTQPSAKAPATRMPSTIRTPAPPRVR
jgi:hypothetical protein